jgi:hypothetical protein
VHDGCVHVVTRNGTAAASGCMHDGAVGCWYCRCAGGFLVVKCSGRSKETWHDVTRSGAAASKSTTYWLSVGADHREDPEPPWSHCRCRMWRSALTIGVWTEVECDTSLAQAVGNRALQINACFWPTRCDNITPCRVSDPGLSCSTVANRVYFRRRRRYSLYPAMQVAGRGIEQRLCSRFQEEREPAFA